MSRLLGRFPLVSRRRARLAQLNAAIECAAVVLDRPEAYSEILAAYSDERDALAAKLRGQR